MCDAEIPCDEDFAGRMGGGRESMGGCVAVVDVTGSVALGSSVESPSNLPAAAGPRPVAAGLQSCLSDRGSSENSVGCSMTSGISETVRSTEQLEVANVSNSFPHTADINCKPARGDPLDLCGSASAGSRCLNAFNASEQTGLAGCDPLDLCGSAPANPHTGHELNGTYLSPDGCTMYIGSRDLTAFKARVISRLRHSVVDLSGGLHISDLNPFSYSVRQPTNLPTTGDHDDSATVPGVERVAHGPESIEAATAEPAYAPPGVAATTCETSMRLRSPSYLPAPVPSRGAARGAPVSPTDAPT